MLIGEIKNEKERLKKLSSISRLAYEVKETTVDLDFTWDVYIASVVWV